MTDLKPPAVSADAYTEEYYRHHCGPHETWNDHDGRVIDGYYVGVLREIGFREGERLVDLGAGRGELLAAAVQAGASSAVGIEYSTAAVALAEETLKAQDVAAKASVLHGDVRDTGLDSGQADVVTMLDVVEHLTPDEVGQALSEARRLLAPGGRVVVHTMPNALVYEVTYRLQRLSRPGRLRRWPRNPRHPLEVQMHINEYTLRRLRKAVRAAGFEAVDVRRGGWVLDHFLPEEGAKRLYHRLASHRVTAPFGSADLWASGRRP
jgi:ubiquinone/menaquinone biosynthesis C-methylase UbiE